MRTKHLAILLAGLFFFSVSLEAQMRGGYGGESWQRGERPDRVRLHERLDLSPEQAEQLTALRTEHQKQMIDRRAELQKLRISLNTEMRKENPDMGAIEELIRTQESNRTAMQLARVEHLQNVRGILTPEQQAIWQMYRTKFGEFGDRRGLRRGDQHRGRR